MNNLITFYQERFNLQNALFTRIEHEEAIVAIVYKVTQPDNKSYILKIRTRPSHYYNEVYFLKYFVDKLPVARIVQIVEPGTNTNGAILMEYLPGTLLKMADITDSIAYEVGTLLAHIHSNTGVGYGDLTQPDTLKSNPIFDFTQKFKEGLSECTNHLANVTLKKCLQYYNKHIDLLNTVDGPCITHRDFRPGNLIVNNKIQGIIDWAGGRASFAEEDFCPLEFGEWTLNKFSKESFLEGYASVRLVPDYGNVMPLLSLSRTIATIGFTIKSGTWASKNANLYQRNIQFLENFLEKQGT